VDHIVIGGGMSQGVPLTQSRPAHAKFLTLERGGVVGLAVARALLQRFPDRSTILVERHTRPGEETR
jgi:cation diffusion facilitator CzcD-associated flavoprotein CzcO